MTGETQRRRKAGKGAMDLIRDFAAKVEKLYVIEELDPFMVWLRYNLTRRASL